MFTHNYNAGYIHGYCNSADCRWQIAHYTGVSKSYRAAQLAITKHLRKLYLDWLNNYLTSECFAKDLGISLQESMHIVRAGREMARKTGRY